MATRTDAGYKLTDDELAKLEDRISEVYEDASKDLQATAKKYFGRFAAQDSEMAHKVLEGEITVDEYRQWRTNTFGRGQKYNTMAANMAERATDANTIAAQYINDAMPSVYALNRNYTAYALDYVMQDDSKTVFGTGDQSSGNIDWNLMDENTVRRLIVEQPETMPNYPAQRAINRGIDLAYGQKRIGETITSGIIRGVSVRKMASELTNTITTMSKTSAIRAARTACTSAQNGGRQDMLNYAVDTLGIKANKMWIATKDDRTRDSHRELDGVQVEYNKKFPNRLMYPGDSTGAPEEVYNCRCCLGYVLPETEDDFNGDGQYATGNTVESYQEWLNEQWAAKSGGGWGGFASGPVAAEAEIRKITSDNFTDKPSEKFMEDFNSGLEKCPKTVQDMYLNNADNLDIADAHNKKGAYYDLRDDGIHINEAKIISGDDCHEPMQNAFHEWGHQLDAIASRKYGNGATHFSKEFKNGAISAAITTDFNNLAVRAANDLGLSAKDIRSKSGKLNAIVQWMQLNNPVIAQSIAEGHIQTWVDDQNVMRALGSVSDILGSQDGDSFPLGVGHKKSYWTGTRTYTPQDPCVEFWAEYCDGFSNTASGQWMKEYFPTAYGLCDEMAEIVAYGIK